VTSQEEWSRLDQEEKRERFVNLYRRVWGTNAGLTAEELAAMSKEELDESINSLARACDQRIEELLDTEPKIKKLLEEPGVDIDKVARNVMQALGPELTPESATRVKQRAKPQATKKKKTKADEEEETDDSFSGLLPDLFVEEPEKKEENEEEE